MARKNGLNLFYDFNCKKREMKGEFNLKKLPLENGCYLNKNHLVSLTGVSRKNFDKIVGQLQLGHRYFKSTFVNSMPWYLFDNNVMENFIAKVMNYKGTGEESAVNLYECAGDLKADFHFERWESGDLLYIISYPAGINPEKIVSGFLDWREYTTSLGSLYNKERSFSVEGHNGKIYGRRLNESGKDDNLVEITFVDSNAFDDCNYPRNKKIREKYEYTATLSLDFLLQHVK